MSEEKVEKVVIIGSGPAGWAAAIYTARAELQPIVYEGAINNENYANGMLPLGQLAQTTEVENYPGFPTGDLSGYFGTAFDERKSKELNTTHHKAGVSGPELMELMRQQAKNFGTRVVTDDILSCDFSTTPFTLKTLAGEQIKAKAVIIATGASANYLGLESETNYKNKGVSACAVCDGALPPYRNKPLVVVGGGDSAMEEANFLTKYGSKVYIVHRRDEFRASKIMAERVLANEKIEVKWNSTIDEVLGDGNAVTGVRIRSTVDKEKTEELDCTGYFAAIGHTPNTKFLGGQIEMHENGYIKWTVPFRTNTNIEGVFAAGDVADDHYKQAITAAGSGCQAALDAERWLSEQE